MRPARWLLLMVFLGLSLAGAFLLRDAVREVVIVPLAYLSWLGVLAYSFVPQFVKWALLVLAVCLALLWQLIPDPRPSAPDRRLRAPPKGQVEQLAMWVLRARNSNYFKWQLAHRLGRMARELHQLSGGPPATGSGSEKVVQYLTAGTDHSFVEYPTRRIGFRDQAPTPLDLDPSEAVDYLESQMEIKHGGHAAGF